MVCSFCGLETGSPTSHETQEACIEALRTQVSELRNVLQHAPRPEEALEMLRNGAAAGGPPSE